jgi:hypothetical protein
MADFFYDGQVRRYLTQFMRVMSNFSYKDSKGKLTQVPVRYGDMNRQVAQILAKNSENIIQSAPFIACYIKDLQFNREMLSDPTYVSKVQVREREYGYIDENPNSPTYGQEIKNYANTQGANYTVERIMPSPYTATFQADIWTTNTEQKFQLWEQLVILFNPSLEIQTTDNYLDWTSLSLLELTGQVFETRTVPQGLESDISICQMTFTSPIWITPPAKVKKLGIVTSIISNVLDAKTGSIQDGSYNDYELADLYAGKVAKAKISITPGGYDILVLNNIATLLPVKQYKINDATDAEQIQVKGNWRSILDLQAGQFIAGVSQLRLIKSDGNEIVAYITLNPADETSMILSVDQDTVPTNTLIDGRGTINAIVNPHTLNPSNVASATRYLILEDINTYEDVINSDTNQPYDRADAWRLFGPGSNDPTPLVAHANDIIEWNGSQWNIIFDSQTTSTITYITNSYTGVQYKWDGEQWSKSFEGVYESGAWRLVL